MPLGISAAPDTPENKLIALRHQMESAQTIKQQKKILPQIEATGTFQAMMYAAQFLQSPLLRKTAATAVAHIAVAHPEYNGTRTRQILNDILPNLKKADREAVQAYLQKASKGEEGFVSIFNGKGTGSDLTFMWKGSEVDIINPRQAAEILSMKRSVTASDHIGRFGRSNNGKPVYHALLFQGY